MDHISYAIVIEEISRACASTGVILSVQNSLYCDPIYRSAPKNKKRNFSFPYARVEKIGMLRASPSRKQALTPPR